MSTAALSNANSLPTTSPSSSKLMNAFIATRPWSFPVCVGAICIGATMSYVDLHGVGSGEHITTVTTTTTITHHQQQPQIQWSLSSFMLTFVTTLAVHIAGNLTNTHGDYVHGFDKQESSADRTIVDNVCSQTQVYVGSIASFLIGISTGFLLLFRMIMNIPALSSAALLVLEDSTNTQHWYAFYTLSKNHPFVRSFVTLVFIGVFIAYSYTSKPFLFKYRGLGDVVIFLAYGPLLVSGAYLAQTYTLPSFMQLFVALPIGCMTDAVLHGNNSRDAQFDKEGGATTLAVRFGPRGCYYFLLFLYSVAYVSCLYLSWYMHSLFLLLPLLTIPLSVKVAHKFAVQNWTDICEQCGQLSFLFAILQSVAILCSSSKYLRI